MGHDSGYPIGQFWIARRYHDTRNDGYSVFQCRVADHPNGRGISLPGLIVGLGIAIFQAAHKSTSKPKLFTTLACHSAYGDIRRSLDAQKNHGTI